MLFYTRTADGFDVRARMFSPLDGVLEDPATGSANCALGAMLCHYHDADQVDPLLCVRCGQRMSMVAFVTDAFAIRRILDHLGLSTPEAERPPPLREVLRVAEPAEGWRAPAEWE